MNKNKWLLSDEDADLHDNGQPNGNEAVEDGDDEDEDEENELEDDNKDGTDGSDSMDFH